MNFTSSNFDRQDVVRVNPLHQTVVAQQSPASFSTTEETVLRLSLGDTVRTLGEESVWRQMLANLMGHEKSNRLASERLEELRRFAIFARLRGIVDDAMLQRFLNAGYTARQADLVMHFVNRHALKRRALSEAIVAWVVSAAAAAGVYLLSQSVVEEAVVSLIITSLAFVTLASLMAPHDQRPR